LNLNRIPPSQIDFIDNFKIFIKKKDLRAADEDEGDQDQNPKEDAKRKDLAPSSTVSADLLDRIGAMKDDPELMDTANDFVFQLLQLAHDEVERQRRQQQVSALPHPSPSFPGAAGAHLRPSAPLGLSAPLRLSARLRPLPPSFPSTIERLFGGNCR